MRRKKASSKGSPVGPGVDAPRRGRRPAGGRRPRPAGARGPRRRGAKASGTVSRSKGAASRPGSPRRATSGAARRAERPGRRLHQPLQVLHDAPVVGAGPVELEHRELGVVGGRDLAVAEDAGELEDPLEALGQQPLHGVLGAGDEPERPGRAAALGDEGGLEGARGAAPCRAPGPGRASPPRRTRARTGGRAPRPAGGRGRGPCRCASPSPGDLNRPGRRPPGVPSLR